MTNTVSQEVSEKINQLKYTDFDTDYKKKDHNVSDKMTIDWKNVLPKPQSNTSKETSKELRYLSQLTNNLSPQQIDLINLVDTEPLDLFTPILRKNGLSLDKSVFNKIWSMTEPIVMSLKDKYDRPRPYQIADLFGLKIKVTESNTHHTPAYPSGHTAYAAMAALYLDELYPDLADQFFHQVGMAGYARILQGVHYPSDNRASMVITGAIWEDIRPFFI